MRHQLAAIAAEQHGCFTREQALAAGYTSREVKALTRRIAWCDLLVGCHVFECDGFVKLVVVAAGGVATEPAPQAIADAHPRHCRTRLWTPPSAEAA